MIPLALEPLPPRDRSADRDELLRLLTVEDENRHRHSPPAPPGLLGDTPPETLARLPKDTRLPPTPEDIERLHREDPDRLPNYLTYQTDASSGLGTSVSRFSALIRDGRAHV